MSNQEVIDIGIKVAEALSVIHQENLLHRDLKPANVFLAKNRVVLIDFGSAREFIQGKTVGHTRVLSPGYAPLEQYATAAKLGPYTDIYALAATLYHALSGNPPPDALNRTQGVAVPPLPHSTPKHLQDLIMRSLETDTAKRPQTTEEWIRLLQAVSTPGPTPEEWIRRLQAVSTPSPTPPAPSPQPVPPAPQPAPSPTHVAVPMEFDRRNGAYKRDRQGMYLIYLLSIPAYTAITYFFIDNLIFSLLISFSVAFAIFNNLPLWKPQPYTKYYPHRNHVAPASVVAKGTKYLAWVETTKGNFTIELSTSTAPNAVNSFVYLALSRYYEDMSWYRVVPRMLAQTGDPTNTGNGGPGYQIPHEITPNSRNNEEGIVAMARVSDVSSNGGQFIVTLTPIADFDKQHTVIGKVTAGLHVVKSLAATEGPQGVSGHQRDRIVSVVIAKPVSIFQS